MAKIAIEGIRLYAYHGYYEEEQIVGNEFIVDVTLETSTNLQQLDDELTKTVNYETVYLICEFAMKKKVRLLETMVANIVNGIKAQFQELNSLKVRVTKCNPPLGARVDKVWVEIEENYIRKCARCQKNMVCYKDDSCWCRSTSLFAKTVERLKIEYGKDCLCKKCHESFSM